MKRSGSEPRSPAGRRRYDILIAMDDRPRGRALELLALVPACGVAVLVWLLGSDVPFWDDWDLVPILAKAKAGTIGFADYFEMYGVHRFVLPKLVLTQVALATQWNVRVQLMLNVAVVCTTLGAIALIAASTRGRRVGAGAMIGSGLAIFSLSQYDNWLWSGQVGYFLSIALVVWAIAVLARSSWPSPARIGLAALLCALATFSIGFGIVSWIALAPLVWVEASRRRAALGAWLALALACAFLYTSGADFPLGASANGAGGIREIALFFVTVAGTPWTSVAAPALLLGALSLALFGALATRALRADARGSMPWISLGLFALGFAGLTAIIRSRLGWDVAESPRYATPMVLLTVATLHLASRCDPQRRRVSVPAVLVGMLLFVNLSFLPIFWSAAASRNVNRVCTDLAFILGAARVDCVPSGGPQPDFVEQLERARDEGLRPFADPGWFSGAEAPARDLRVSATGEAMSLSGKSAPSLLPAPVIVTRGPNRDPVALLWADASGTWTVRLGRDRLATPPDLLELWTIPRHQKRLVRIGRWSSEARGAADGSHRAR